MDSSRWRPALAELSKLDRWGPAEAVIIYLTGEQSSYTIVFMGMNALPKTLIAAVKYFANPDNCREYLVARRWPNGVTCPTCGSKTV